MCYFCEYGRIDSRTTQQNHGFDSLEEYEAGDDGEEVSLCLWLPLPCQLSLSARHSRYSASQISHLHLCEWMFLAWTWRHKIERNKQRDIEVQHKLAKMGWHVMTVWECQLDTKEKREQTLMAIEYTLNHIFLMDRERHDATSIALSVPSIRPYQLPEEDERAIGMAAEDRHR